jgi:uncharacterized protein
LKEGLLRDFENSEETGGAGQSQWSNPDSEALQDLLERSKRVAVVGLSSDPSRPSNGVAAYLLSQGYEIIPINPKETAPLGIQAYPDLGSVPGKIDIVDVFRRSEYAPEIARQAIEIGASVIWFQEGVISVEAFELATKAGLTVVMDRCMLKEHVRFS